ncbi:MULTISPECIES: hypothetical protein [Burkholderia]|uniref:Uncharacterized protein n=1 Tax=Burkholderia cepacia TaxID=292 RepID=A0AA88Z9A7_BURCE|nr:MULTISPECIES: hypothetical protein [Burkholderia]AOI80282.1 hypothetical protein WS54_28190 [Burkholderia sp. NRF60-BP8]KGC06427.1 hypothetical protein DM43_4877 [Burkholderia cepacia]KVA06608.1 hypothetical protein WS54_29230 [Burkholderia sp. NRF60-BP8]KVL23344.1 hypothetical protein WS95_06995 [Burkholderia sp. MSMB1826]
MRKSTIAATVCVGGLILAAWGAIATMGAVAQISGGSYGSHDVSDFAIENFLFLGPLLALGGLVAWFASRDSATSDDDGDEQPSGKDERNPAAPAHRDAGQ